MVHVLSDYHQVRSQGSGGNQDVRITDELARLVEQGVEVSRLDNDVIRQGQHLTNLTALFEACQLTGLTARLQSSQNIIPGNHRECEVAEDSQVTACAVLDRVSHHSKDF